MRSLLTLCLIALTGWLSGQRTTVQQPVDFLTQFQDISMDPTGTGIAVGSCGAVVVTQDEGANWNRVEGPVAGDDYGAVDCAPAGCSAGVVIGGTGYLALRQSGGSWVITEEFGNSFGVEKIYWLTDQIVIADVGQNEYYRSTDGGQSWDILTLPAAPRDNLAFASAAAGYFLGDDNQVYRSEDQGATWQETGYTHDTIYRRLFTLNDDVLFFMDAVSDLSRSTDGGQSFTTVTPNVSVRTADLFVAFSPDTLGVATGFNTTYLSSDAGATWVRTAAGEVNTGIRNNFHQRGREVWILGSISTIYYSAAGFGDFISQIPAERDNRLQTIAFANDQVGYAAGIRGTLLKTEDGGDNWAPLVVDENSSAQLKDIEIISEDEIIVFSNGLSPQISTDGGMSFNPWLPSSVAMADQQVAIYQRLPGGRQYMLGQSNALYTDDGTNFTVVPLPFNAIPEAMIFPDDLNGWAVGSRKVLRTRDGGESWQEVAAPTTQPIEGVYFFDANNGFVSTGSRLYPTTDGGDTWDGGGSPGGYDFTLNANDGGIYVASFASGNNGTVSRSFDQGETWEEIAYVCAPFRGGTLTPSGKFFYGVGDGGNIVKVDIDVVNPTREPNARTRPLRAFPNPATSTVTIEVPPSRETSTLSIFSASGQLLRQEQLGAGQPRHQVNLAPLPSGLYLLRWSSPEGFVRTARLVRQ